MPTQAPNIHAPPSTLRLLAPSGVESDVESAGSGSTAISGDVLMEIYKLRMSYVNSRLDAVVGKMEEANTRSKALNELATVLAKYANGIDGDDKESKWAQLNQAYITARDALPASDPMRDQIEQQRMSENMRYKDGPRGDQQSLGPNRLIDGKADPDGPPGDYVVDSQEMQSLQKAIEGMQKSNDSDNQMAGMLVNQLMNQQQETVTLFSGMQQSLHQAVMSAIGNIGKG